MTLIVGVSGLCGSGKSTAVGFLERLCPGRVVYLGGLILQELDAQGLPRSPENERRIQTGVRDAHGPKALAVLGRPTVARHLDDGANVIVDAIFVPEELAYLKEHFPSHRCITLAVHASLHIRQGRLGSREVRPLSPKQIRERDWNEVVNLGSSKAITLAEHHVANNGSLEELHKALEAFWMVSRNSHT